MLKYDIHIKSSPLFLVCWSLNTPYLLINSPPPPPPPLMESPAASWVVLLALAGLGSVALLSKVFSFRRPYKQNLPPGPKPWQFIGNLNLMDGSSPPPVPPRTVPKIWTNNAAPIRVFPSCGGARHLQKWQSSS